MIDFELEQLSKHLEWQRLLANYRQLQLTAREQNPEHDGWVPRVRDIEDVALERLPRIHGKLIALGYLKFQLGGRNEGVWYQVSGQGIQALSRLEQDDHDEPMAKSA